MSQPRKPPYLAENFDAFERETFGLNASLAGDQPLARDYYDEALTLIPTNGTADTAAQRGSVIRNDGFTFVRDAIATEEPENQKALFERASHRLREALGQTALLVSGAERPNYQQIGPHQTHKKQRRELLSTHAATLGLIARAATAEEVVLTSTTETRQDRANYGLAHDFARLGTNGYFRVSNAMNGARDERIQGNARLPHTAVWLSRAAFGIVWSVKNDRGNLTNALRTFAGRMPDLVTPSKARQSVRNRP